MVKTIIKTVPASRKLATFVVNSIFVTGSFVCWLAMQNPAYAPQIWLCHKVIMALSVCCFVDLTMDWYGGEAAMVSTIGEKTHVDMSCKLFWWLPCHSWMKEQTLTKTWLRVKSHTIGMSAMNLFLP